jgi:putative Mg2+ transporter-C (MgtC) family protein
MAAGAGLLLLAVTVTVLHFVIIVGFAPLARRLTNRLAGSIHVHITYQDDRGVLRQIVSECEKHGWQVGALVTSTESGGLVAAAAPGDVAVALTISGNGVLRAPGVLITLDGVSSVRQVDDEAD